MKLVDISKGYQNLLYENLSYSFEENKVYSIFASNGAGKTTLLKIMSNQIEPDSGHIENKKDIMFISDVFMPFEHLTGKEYIKYTMRLKEIECSDDHILELAKTMNLEDYVDICIGKYSKGMKYKLLMVILFISKPDIVLLDEPFIDLDMATKRTIADILKNYKTNKIIVFTTHLLEIAIEFSDRILYLNRSSFDEIDNNDEQKVSEFVNYHMNK